MEPETHPSQFLNNIRKLLESSCCTYEHGNICICTAITPILRYCQCFGIFPNSLETPTWQICHSSAKPASVIHTSIGPIRKSPSCFLKSRWTSLGSITNIFLCAAFSIVATWVAFNVHIVLRVYFDGTDFYAFGTQSICLYTQALLVLYNSLLQRNKFSDVWQLLLKILKQLSGNDIQVLDGNGNGNGVKDVAITTILQETDAVKRIVSPRSKLGGRLKLIRLTSYVLVLIVLILSIGHTITFFLLTFQPCFEDSDHQTKINVGMERGQHITLPCPFSNFFLLLQKLFYTMIDFVQQGLAMLFGVMCLIVYVFYREVEEQLECVLQSGNDLKSNGIRKDLQVENLRLCHEDLGHCCRRLSQCFGMGLLPVMITSVVSFTVALYAFTLSSGAIDKEETLKVARFYVIWAIHGWFGCFCLTLILVPGQMISNASEGPRQVIGRCSLVHLDKATKYQLSQFLHQTQHRVILTACHVANVGVSFIAAAATNVTTYVIVILQFRLGVEKS